MDALLFDDMVFNNHISQIVRATRKPSYFINNKFCHFAGEFKDVRVFSCSISFITVSVFLLLCVIFGNGIT